MQWHLFLGRVPRSPTRRADTQHLGNRQCLALQWIWRSQEGTSSPNPNRIHQDSRVKPVSMVGKWRYLWVPKTATMGTKWKETVIMCKRIDHSPKITLRKLLLKDLTIRGLNLKGVPIGNLSMGAKRKRVPSRVHKSHPYKVKQLQKSIDKKPNSVKNFFKEFSSIEILGEEPMLLSEVQSIGIIREK